MTLLRDDRLTTLNELLVRCEDAALQYRDAADYAPKPELAEAFLQLAEERRAHARVLAGHVRGLGDLPDVPDTDREWLRRMKAVAKVAVAGDEQDLTDRLSLEVAQLEAGIAEQAEKTLATGISGPARTAVHRLLETAQTAERRFSP